ncbi:MAG: tannase/feruloyl esterase family alpha/beta hydrolase [Opitutaceae bacterium]|nr:tannase/feruloyl esterase family alpha/beta hydrolase [Opitutaceae bacterium]
MDLAFDNCTVTRDASDTIAGPRNEIVANVPPRTIVRLDLHPSEKSTIRVEIWLPDKKDWNGCFLGLGSGGMGGYMLEHKDFAAPLRQGYATAYSDLGTTVSGIGNPDVWKDFGHRATHLTAVAGKAITKNFYGRAPEFSYFKGGSTGGQQALSLAQRHPDDYDGIIAGVPAHRRVALHAWFVWNEQIFQKCPFTESQANAIRKAGYDVLAPRTPEKLAGKTVADPVLQPGDIDAVIRHALKNDPSLTPAHAAALKKLFEGPRRADTGEKIFDGIPLGAPLWRGGDHFYPFRWSLGADFDFLKFDFAGDYEKYRATLSPDLDAENTDLEPFRKRGGKLLMYSGAVDAIVPFHATLDYYNRVSERQGGRGNTREFFRYWIIPGMGHSWDWMNRGPDWLTLLRNWREKGVVPGEVKISRVDANGVIEAAIPVLPQ